MNIEFACCVRCNPRVSYYEKKFKDFEASEIYVSEFSPRSHRNSLLHKFSWLRVSEFNAKNCVGVVFYKNASFHGGGRYYVAAKLY